MILLIHIVDEKGSGSGALPESDTVRKRFADK